MKTIAQEWELFLMYVLPAEAPPVQRQEMRRAFYAGVEAARRMQWAIGAHDVSEAEAMQTLDDWARELQEFAAAVQAGRR